MALGDMDVMGMLRRLLAGLSESSQPKAELPAEEKTSQSPAAGSAVVKKETDARRRFFADVKKYAARTGSPAHFVPMRSYWPMYEAMNPAQTDWYFYWRDQVRSGVYPETDEAYILLNCYEILCDSGFTEPEEGYNQMKALLEHYRAAFPRLDFVLTDWLFDFALMHNIRFDLHFDQSDYEIKSPVMTDVLTAIEWDEAFRENRPVRLQFPVIDALTDYKIGESRFYRDGHALLMQHAIPRVVALMDADAIKHDRLRPLELFAPKQPISRRRDIYTGAICPDAGRPVTVSVIPYSQSRLLAEWIDSLIRLTENELRRLTGYRGRLRGIMPEGGQAALVRLFLEREYGDKKPAESEAETQPEPEEKEKKPGLALDFEKIGQLRQQSDVVREALRVDTEEFAVPDEEFMQEQPIELVTQSASFCMEKLEGELKDLMVVLSQDQQAVIAVCLQEKDVTATLERLAADMMSMPALLVDEINQAALETMGDIILEETADAPEIVEAYREPLKKALIVGA